jgi:DNA-binding MarR family transcriptional regulator
LKLLGLLARFDRSTHFSNNQRVAERVQSVPRTEAPPFEEQAYIVLQRSADRLQARFAKWLKPSGLSPTQYNALRILRGAGERGLPCSEIGERMITRDPDVTRLVDRLAKRGLVLRGHDKKDRRVVRATITANGLEQLHKLDAPLQEFLRSLLGHLEQGQLRKLIDLLESAAPEQLPANESCP